LTKQPIMIMYAWMKRVFGFCSFGFNDRVIKITMSLEN
jgi:hypothetical protein